VTFDEVKASREVDPNSRQYERLKKRVKVLRDGYDPSGGVDGAMLRLRRLPVPYRTHLHELAEVVAEAHEHGVASRQVEDGMVVSAVDYRRHRATGDTYWFTQRELELGWTPADDRHFQGMALVRRLRERIKADAYLAPVTIFPMKPTLIADLLLGSVDYAVTIRAESIEDAFAARGITAHCAAGREANRTFLKAYRGEFNVTVPAATREQMVQETMTCETLVDVIERMLDSLEDGTPTGDSQMLFCDESDTWEHVAVATS
jgi:hypothetical protein